jgi:hypothetical protein
MSSLIEQSGGGPQKQPKYVPIFMDRSFTGLFTQRSVLHDPSDVITAKYYGGRPDALWMGKNIELTNRLTLQRRPGLTALSATTYPTPPNRSYSFQLTDGTIRLIVDTGSTGSLTLTSVGNASGTSTIYTGTITGGAANAFVGYTFLIAGFTNTPNNGAFVCTASSATTLTLTNAGGIAETHAATAISTGAVYWDQQNGVKTLLFSKSPGAGSTYFQAVAGILYMGDGVDTRKYTPLNPNLPPGGSVSIWNWGIVAPTLQPSVTIVSSGAAAVNWTAGKGSTGVVWSTMGLVYDNANNAIYQLNSVNASTTNTTQFGTTGAGQPAWNQTPGGTTSDNTITWTNRGPIVAWTANTVYNNATVGGTATNPCIIYDPNTKACYINGNPGSAAGTSGHIYPQFKSGAGQTTQDGSVKWFYIGVPGTPSTWQKSHAYPQIGTVPNNDAGSSIVEPTGLQNGLPTNVTLFWQVSGGGTSASSATSPFSAATDNFGAQTTDGDLIWLSLGSGAWAATTVYSAWSQNGVAFNALKDTNGNFQVCTTTGTSATVQPGTSYSITSVSNASGGNTVYHYSSTTAMPVGDSTHPVFAVFSGFANPANNGTFKIVSSTATSVTVANASGVADTTGTAIYNPWPTGYGGTTFDGTVVWTCVGSSMTWAASTNWFLPVPGFSPPSPSSPFGGASVIDSNNDVEFIVNSGLGGTTQPTWNAIGAYTADGGTPLTLTQVTVSGTSTTYTGTITGGGSNAFVGQQFLIAGFTNAGNNVLIVVTASTASTLVCTTSSQVNETHAGTATTGAIWYNLEPFTAQSLSWKIGHVYAYSFKARAFDDFYSVAINGKLPVPPGLSNPLPPPTGSATEAVSTASPVFTIVGANTGAVNTISGVGSTDPQVDTIIIWRDADGGGAGQMFELTEIPAPPPIGGIAQPWTFQDFLPDAATSQFPGLNTNIPAPIDEVNNPPFSSFLPMAYNFQRIWGADGEDVPFSGGPDTKVGNPNEAFAPADSLPFLAPVIRLVKTPQGLVTFLTDSVEVIAGGPLTASFFSVTWVPGVGLRNYDALDVLAGEMYFFSADNQFRIMTPSLNVANAGFALGDQFANMPSSGVSDATWDSSKVYVASHQNGIDNCVIVADGSTGWYRLNPHQAGAQSNTEPVWSPFAAITNGCKMVQSVETSPGIKKLLVGGSTDGQPILFRDLTVYTDNGTPYGAFFVMGSITLAHPGQLALLKFMEFDFSGVSFHPTISYLLNEISGTFKPFATNPQFDPPSLYGTTITPSSYSPNRYYFLSNASLARCRHMQIKVDFGTTSSGDEMYNATIFGRLMIET